MSECTIKCPYLQNFLCSSKLPNYHFILPQKAPLASLILFFLSTSKLSYHGFNLRQKALILTPLLSKWYQQCQLPKHCLKKRQKVPFSHFAFKFYSAVPTSKSSIQIASEATIMRSCFQNITSTSKLPNYCFKLRQRAPFYVLDFKILSAVSTSKSSIQIA